MLEARRPPGTGGATDQLGQTSADNDSCSRSTAQPLEQLRHRPSERYADHIGRLKAAGIFTTWPAVLDLDPPVPLGMGIGRELEGRLDQSRCAFKTLRELIRRHVVSPPYLRTMVAPGAWRHDIDGTPVEPVSKEHRRHAFRERARSRPGWRQRGAAHREAKIAAAAEKRRREDQERRAAVARAVIKKIRTGMPIAERRANAALPTLRLERRI